MFSYNKLPYTVPVNNNPYFSTYTDLAARQQREKDQQNAAAKAREMQRFNAMSPEEKKAKLQMDAAERDAVEIARMRQLQVDQYLQRQEAAKSKSKNTAKSTELETYSLTRGNDIINARSAYRGLKEFNTQMFTGSSKEAKAYRYYPGAWTDGPIYAPPGSKQDLEYQRSKGLADSISYKYTASQLGSLGLDPQSLESKLRNSSIPDLTKVYQPKFYDFEQALLRAEAKGASADQNLVDQMNSLKEELEKLSSDVVKWAKDPLVQGAVQFWASGRAADKKQVRYSNQLSAQHAARAEAGRLKFINNPEEFIRASQSNLVKAPEPGESVILINRPDLDQLKAPRAVKKKPIPKFKPPRRR